VDVAGGAAVAVGEGIGVGVLVGLGGGDEEESNANVASIVAVGPGVGICSHPCIMMLESTEQTISRGIVLFAIYPTPTVLGGSHPAQF
jgi:hypothetical protein